MANPGAGSVAAPVRSALPSAATDSTALPPATSRNDGTGQMAHRAGVTRVTQRRCENFPYMCRVTGRELPVQERRPILEESRFIFEPHTDRTTRVCDGLVIELLGVGQFRCLRDRIVFQTRMINLPAL
jgi:hypothetical protein